MLKKIVKAFLPPIVPYVIGKVTPAKNNHPLPGGADVLFDGDDALFKGAFGKDTVYGEYGCGASTIWVANTIGCRIFSVDSSPKWIEFVKNKCKPATRPTLHWADVGPVGDWGMPRGHTKPEGFTDYTDWLWANDEKPNVVLVDGRFRVCCFLTSLLKSDEGTKIFSDDYTSRPEYHFVERFVKPIKTCGRQALFVVPAQKHLDMAGIKDAINKFRFVFA